MQHQEINVKPSSFSYYTYIYLWFRSLHKVKRALGDYWLEYLLNTLRTYSTVLVYDVRQGI